MSLDIIRIPTPDMSVDLGKAAELPAELVGRTLQVAAPAIEHRRMLSANIFKLDDEIHVNAHGGNSQEPTYHIFEHGWVTLVNDRQVQYDVRNDRTAGSISRSVGSVDIWGTTEEELDAKVQVRRDIRAQQQALEADHELGPQAAHVVLNEFGGFDYRNPDETARHLALRGLIMSLTNYDGDPTRIGMLHPLLDELMGHEFKEHVNELKKIFGGVALMSEARRDPFLALAFEQAVENSGDFVQAQRPALELTTTALVEPELLKRVMSALAQNGQLPQVKRDPRAGLWEYRSSPFYSEKPR
jgi:hypothetical protein